MAVLDDIKLHLDITADNLSEDEKIKSIIEDGKERLRDFNPLLSDEDFESPGLPRFLLKSYCRYAYSNASEAFVPNYKDDLLTLRQRYEVIASESENTD